MTKLRKALAISVSVMTVFSMSMIAVPFQAEAASAGDLIKIDGYAPVYYLGDDMKRYVFPNESTYFSWYSDFSSVVAVDQAEVEGYALAANVVMRPGTSLVKRPVPTDPKVYAVEPGGVLRHVPDEATAVALYGDDWASMVVDVADSFFVNYSIGSGEVSSTVYPAGSLVKFDGGADVYYINEDGDAQKIADEAAFNANRFAWGNVLNAPAGFTMPAAGDDITAKGMEADTSQGGNSGTGPVVNPDAGSGLSVALSSDTAISDVHPAGSTTAAAMVPFVTYNFTAANDGDVVIENVMLMRTGLGDENELGDVYLFDGDTRLTKGKSINSDDEVSFTGVDFVIPAGTTKSLTVKVDLNGAGGANGSHAFVLVSASDVTTDGATVSGSFPMKGNAMALSDTDVAAVSYKLVNSNGDVTVGETDEDVLEIDIEELSGDEDVALYSIMFEQKGTISNSDLSNFGLFDGSKKLDADIMIDGDYITFTLGTPYIIEEGDTETLNVAADIDGGVGDTIGFDVDEVFDIVTVGQKYGYVAGVVVDGASAIDTNSVDGGALAINEDDSNLGTQDLAKNTDNVVFLAAEFDAQDEPITITELDVTMTFSAVTDGHATNDYVKDIALYLDGDLVAGPEDVAIASGTNTSIITFEDEFTVTGKQVLTVVADITDDSGNGTYVVTINSSTIDAEDQEGDAIVNDGGGDDVVTGTATGNNVKVGLDNATIAKDSTLGNQNFVAGDDDYLLGRFIIDAGDSEGLIITEYSVDITVGTVTIDDVINLYVDDTSEISSPDAADNVYAVNEELAAGETKVVSVYMTVDSDYTGAGTVVASLAATAEGQTSGEDIALSSVTGQTMTLANGSLALTVDASTPDADAVIGGATTEVLVGSFEFAATNLGYEITELVVGAFTDAGTSTASLAAITMLSLNVEGTEYNATVNNGVATFNTDFRVEDDDETTVDIYATFNDIDNMTATEKVQVGISDYSYVADNESVEEEGVTDNSYVALATDEVFEVFNTLLTVTSERGSAGTSMQNGENEILDITFTADAADDATIIALTVTTAFTGTGSTTAVNLRDSNDDLVATTADGVFTGLTEEIGAGESKTYYIEVVVAGSIADDSVTAKLVESGFSWSDGEATRDGSLVEDLPGDTYEITK